MRYTVSSFVWICHCLCVYINGFPTDLTANQTQIWFETISEINGNSTDRLQIEIVEIDHDIDIPLFQSQEKQTRYLFKQDIHKQVECYVEQNQELITSIPLNIYDPCHESLYSRKIQANQAGIYISTDDQRSQGLALILVDINSSLTWFNGTRVYRFSNQTSIQNGTQLSLAFETMIYYNSNSDIPSLNTRIDEIIQQVSFSIEKTNDKFFFMENISCQRHESIVYDELRLLILTCTTKVTFLCPLQIGSTCWIENKRLSNIELNIHSKSLPNTQAISIQIDV